MAENSSGLLFPYDSVGRLESSSPGCGWVNSHVCIQLGPAVHGGGWAHSASQLAGQQSLFSSRRPHLVASLGFLIWQLTENKGGFRKMSSSLSMGMLLLSLLLNFFGQRNSQRHPRFKEWENRLCLLMGRAAKHHNHVSSIYCIYLLLHCCC